MIRIFVLKLLGMCKERFALRSETVNRKLPSNFLQTHKSHFDSLSNYESPGVKLWHFKSIHFLADSTLFFSILPVKESFIFFRGRIILHNLKGIFSIRRKWERILLMNRKIPYLLIHDCWTLNYYHWITQAIPRLVFAKEKLSHFILILPESHKLNFHKESLSILGIENVIFLEQTERYYLAKNLVYASRDIQIGDYNSQLIMAASEIIRRSLGTWEEDSFDRIFILRKVGRGRKILNIDNVLKIFKKYNFAIVVFEDLEWKEQIRMLRGCKILAGVHGAGLTNMMFLDEQSKVFELTTRLQGDQYYFYTLSNVYGHSYYYQYCESPGDNKSTIQEDDLIVDEKILEDNLLLMTNDIGNIQQ